MAKFKRTNSLCPDPHQLLLDYVKKNSVREIVRLIRNNQGLLNLEYEEYGLSILEMACFVHADDVKPETIEALLKLGADPTKTFERYGCQSCLHLATLGQNPSLLNVIASNKQIDINSTSEGQSALIILVIDGDTSKKMKECVEVLWRNGIDIHNPDNKNNTALYFAAKKKYTEIVNFILSKDNTVTSKEADVLKVLDPNLKYIIDDTTQTQTGLDFLKRYKESEFISWSSTNPEESNEQQNNLEESYLQFACQRHLLNVVDYLIDIDPNKVGKCNQTHPLIIAIENGYYQIVERLINAPNLEINPNVLNAALKRVDWDGGGRSNYQKTCELILSIESLNVNTKDPLTGNYPLHFAVKYGGKKIVRDLLRRNASLANRDNRNLLAVNDIDHDTLKEHFDSCVQAHPGDPKDQNRENVYLTFDYASLIPTESLNEQIPNLNHDCEGQILQKPQRSVVKENEVVLHMIKDRELKPLLQHPLIVSFLYVKWHRVRFLFLANLIMYLVFCASLLLFILSNYNQPREVPCNFAYLFLLFTTLTISCREFFQVMFMCKKYFKNMENYVEVALLIDVYIMLLSPSSDNQRRPMFAFAILLAALELLFLLGSVPGLSTYIVMLRTVSYNFLKFLMFNAILIVAFAFAFYTLFRKTLQPESAVEVKVVDETKEEKTEFFSNIYLALFKTLVMLTGEFEAGDLDFDQFPIASHVIFIMFVVLIAIILLNLLNGLAVSDTQEIKNEAKLVALTARAQYVSYIESMVFDNVLPSNCHRTDCLCGANTMKTNWSRWWLTRVCISPLLDDCKLKVYPNQAGKIDWGRRTTKSCGFLCAGDKLDESSIKAAKMIIVERQPRDHYECNTCKKLYESIQELTEQIKKM